MQRHIVWIAEPVRNLRPLEAYLYDTRWYIPYPANFSSTHY